MDSMNGSVGQEKASDKPIETTEPAQEDAEKPIATPNGNIVTHAKGSRASSTTGQRDSRKTSGQSAYLPDGSPLLELELGPLDYKEEEADHFSEAHGKLWRRWQGGVRMSKSEEEKIAGDPLTWRDLFRPPIVRQWVHDGKLYKAQEMRRSSYIELFFDLSYIGSIHLLADASVRPDPRGVNIGVFVITFFVAFGQWNQMRRLINCHGSDDCFERLYILFRMILIIGYASCATGIEVVQTSSGGWEIPEELLPNVYWAARFILIAGLVHFALLVQMAIVLTRFRWAVFYEAARLLPYLLLFLPLAFEGVTSTSVILSLSVTSIAAEWQIGWMVGFLAHHRSKHHLGWRGYRLAHNIEHLIDRSMAFVVLTLGEHLLQASYEAYQAQLGFGKEYGRASCVVIISFLLLWIYSDSDCSRLYVHALRAWWTTCVAVQQVFYILVGALILASAPITNLIQNEYSVAGYHYYYAESIAVYMLCVLAIGLMHQSYDKPGSALINRWIRLSGRAVCAAWIACVPLIDGLTNLAFLSLLVAGLTAEVAFEQVGKIGLLGDVVALREEEAPKHHGHPPKYRLADLSEDEKGFQDAGIEDELGAIHAVTLRASQRVAFTV